MVGTCREEEGHMKTETTQKRKPYGAPRLVVYGNLRSLTMAKDGTKGDGTGKPATKSTGANA